MNYAQAMDYLAEAGKRGIVPGLDTVRNLLRYLGNPQNQLKFVHVAGTNGKGSTTAMIASVLQAAGYVTGRYTSPAVFCDREKYAVNGAWISEEEYAACMDTVRTAVQAMESDRLNLPTSFEVETALAMLHFVRSGCEIVVLETGMGGAMDATNVVENTQVCVLTAIGMDHMKFLGGTLGEITAQKAGIIKPGCTAVVHKQAGEVIEAVQSACLSAGAAMVVSDPENIIPLGTDAAGQRFRYGPFTVDLPLQGRFQQDNAAGAIEAVLALRDKGFDIPDRAITEGLKNVSWPGRLQRIHSSPEIYVDGAHNPNAAARLAEAIGQILPGKRLICIMGVLADKDFGEVARMVCSRAETVITVTPDNPRALPADKLVGAVRPHCADVRAAGDVQSALQAAVSAAGSDGVILAFGSLSYLKEIVSLTKEL